MTWRLLIESLKILQSKRRWKVASGKQALMGEGLWRWAGNLFSPACQRAINSLEFPFGSSYWKLMKACLHWGLRIGMFAVLAYFLQPLYLFPKGTQPSTRSANDSVTWKFFSDPNPAVTQTFTIYGDGRSVVSIIRPYGDPDLPEGTGWQVRRSEGKEMIEHRKENVVMIEKARDMFNTAIDIGILDLEAEFAMAHERLEIQCSFDGVSRSVTGPRHMRTVVDSRPKVWVNRIRWQKMGDLIHQDPTLKSLLARKEITLVND